MLRIPNPEIEMPHIKALRVDHAKMVGWNEAARRFAGIDPRQSQRDGARLQLVRVSKRQFVGGRFEHETNFRGFVLWQPGGDRSPHPASDAASPSSRDP